MRHIFKRVIDFCWFCFKWGLVLGVVAAGAAVPYFYRRMDEEIRSRVEARIAQHYPGLKVTVGRAELVEGEGIKVHDVVIREPGAEGPRPELIRIEEVVLGCQAELKDLIQGEPKFTHITIRRPTLYATRRRDGGWSSAKLLPPPQLSDHPIETRIESGAVEIFDPLRNSPSALTLRDVNLLFSPLDAAAQAATPDARRLQGTLTGDHVRHAELAGVVDLKRQAWTIGGSVEGLDISPEMHAALPEPWAAKLAAAAGLRGEAALSFRLSCDPAAESPYQYQVVGHLSHGRIDDRRLPHPLTDLRATIHLDNGGFFLEELAGHSNQAEIRLSCRQTGFDAASPKVIEAEIRQAELDREVLAALPESLQEQWHKYRPAGLIDADMKLWFDGRDWHPDLTVRCLNVSFTYCKFPYRLEEGKGTVTLKDDLLRLSLTAYSGNQPVRLDGEWSHIGHVGHEPSGWFEAKGDDIQLDAKLLAAIPEGSRAVVQSLNPAGLLDFYVRLWRGDGPQEPMHKHLVIAAKRCSLRYDKFPYAIGNVSGMIDMLDNSWRFSDFRGANGTGSIFAAGQLTPTLQGNELSLRLVGNDVTLDKELREALRVNEQQVWNVLRPRGVIDLVADIRYVPDLPEPQRLSLEIRAVPQSESTSIEPVHFPYRLERLQGVLNYRNGHVDLKNFRAEHGPVKLSTGGFCDFLPDGMWHLRLENLSADRLRLDRDLIQALPERLKKALVDLRPAGAVNLRGSFDVEPGAHAGDPVQWQWDVQLGLLEQSVDCGVPLHNICGTVALQGVFDGRHLQSRGELDLESLNYRDYQFTQVRGPLWIEDQQVLLGSWVARRINEGIASDGKHAAERPRPLTGHVFGGTVTGDGRMTLGQDAGFDVHASLLQADLARCAREVMCGPQNLRGTVAATVDLRGTPRSTNALSGRGSVRLSDADIYELPLMISLLKILSIRAPDRNAFSKSAIDFRIEGEHIYFDRIDFNGDAISLLGTGEMDFQQAIKLTFHAIVGSGDLNVPVLREIFTGASRQIMLLHVGGTLQNPEPWKEAFPGVNQALQQLQAERPNGGTPALPPPPWQGRSNADSSQR